MNGGKRSFAAGVHPDDSERFKTYADRALLTGAAYELEVRLRKSDGSYRWFLARDNLCATTKVRSCDGILPVPTLRDRKQAEDALHAKNVVLREEIDKSPRCLKRSLEHLPL